MRIIRIGEQIIKSDVKEVSSKIRSIESYDSIKRTNDSFNRFLTKIDEILNYEYATEVQTF